jgi:hypothetical protein
MADVPTAAAMRAVRAMSAVRIRGMVMLLPGMRTPPESAEWGQGSGIRRYAPSAEPPSVMEGYGICGSLWPSLAIS